MTSRILNNKAIIIGGGLGGLLAGNILYQNGYPVEIYERDENAESRSQGYFISITKAGLESLNIAGIKDEVIQISQPGKGLDFTTRSGYLLVQLQSISDSPYYTIVVNRKQLRQLLISKLPPDVIHWNSKFQSYQEQDDKVIAIMENGKEIIGDVLIGADGVNSKVVQQLLGSKAKLNYLGLTLLGGSSDIKYAPKCAKSGSGTCMMLGIGSAFFMRYFNSTYFWSYTLCCKNEFDLNNSTNKDTVMNMARQKIKQYSEPVISTIQDCDPSKLRFRNLYDRLPISFTSKRVTVVGDACHPMSPFQGQGANSAFIDAAELTSALLSFTDVPTALQKYQDKMIPRTYKAVSISRQSAYYMHSESWLVCMIRNAFYWLLGWFLRPKTTISKPNNKKD